MTRARQEGRDGLPGTTVGMTSSLGRAMVLIRPGERTTFVTGRATGERVRNAGHPLGMELLRAVRELFPDGTRSYAGVETQRSSLAPSDSGVKGFTR